MPVIGMPVLVAISIIAGALGAWGLVLTLREVREVVTSPGVLLTGLVALYAITRK